MWVIALFDLPTETKRQRRAYTLFRRALLKDGFGMMQYSVYRRHCASHENAQSHIRRMGGQVPAEGEVRFLVITDKQFSRMEIFWGGAQKKSPPTPVQLMLF
ncbi:MAG: CRISPR-associated endonuclease Cas2 [Magnetococcales bacterium]|nr:CRISPR-associated endonuclease Cas2 [Magnetococcales bacterium]